MANDTALDGGDGRGEMKERDNRKNLPSAQCDLVSKLDRGADIYNY